MDPTAWQPAGCWLPLVALAYLLASGPVVFAQAPAGAVRDRVSIIYSGRSLGALGVLRDADEHGLLLEAAQQASLSVRTSTVRAWRAPNVTLFSPDRDLLEPDLRAFLDRPRPTGPMPSRRALRSNNVTLLQERPPTGPDLMALVLENLRTAIDFPDLVWADVECVQGVFPDGSRWVAALEERAAWPTEAIGWSPGEVGVLDAGTSRVFELQVNLGELAPRATLVKQAVAAARGRGAHPIVVDLGLRDGDLGLERQDRARVDYAALASLGYSIIVPYELELSLGLEGLTRMRGEFPGLTFLAANVAPADSTASVLEPHQIVEVDGITVGLFGIVDPDLQGVLAKSALRDFAIEAPLDAAARETRALRAAGVNAVVMLSNLHPRDNAFIAREVMGIDAIVADLHVRWSPESLSTDVVLPERPRSRPGSPALVTRSFANGLGLGTLDLAFARGNIGRPFLARLSHSLQSVTDRTPPDTVIRAKVLEMAGLAARPRGDVLIPPFEDLVAHRPSLADYDATTKQGRVSKSMWESFLARLVRYRGGAEIGMIRKLPHFPPAIGALREADVRAWLWTEDAIVTLDLSGADIRRILAEDVRRDLVMSGIDREAGTIQGRPLQSAMLYRVAATDLLFDGARFRAFDNARRVVRHFRLEAEGQLRSDKSGAAVPVRTLVLEELKRLNAANGGQGLDRLARLFDRDPPFEPLFAFSFDRPTVFASLNRSRNTEAYGAVPESRVVADNSFVIGMSGRYEMTFDLPRINLDMGAVTVFSRQSSQPPGGSKVVAEMADDLQFDLTARRNVRPGPGWQVRPFLRGVFDTEFTPTINPETRARNPRERIVRGLGGVQFTSGGSTGFLEVAGVIEDDLASHSVEAGLQVRSDYQKALGGRAAMTYRLTNDFTYFFPVANDDLTDLAVSYAMVHEILIPLVNELSLSIAADFFVFKGKVDETRTPGASAIVRFGLTYDRLWKPRYQPFF